MLVDVSSKEGLKEGTVIDIEHKGANESPTLLR